MWYMSFFFWLTSPSMRISSSIHVAANGIILSFLWLSTILLSNTCVLLIAYPSTVYKFLKRSGPKKFSVFQWTRIGDGRVDIRESLSYSMLRVPNVRSLNVIATTRSLWQTEKQNVSTQFQMSTELNNHFLSYVPNNTLLCGVNSCYRKKKCL